MTEWAQAILEALGLPVWRLLGGTKKRIRAYAGGISLGYQPPESLADHPLLRADGALPVSHRG